jgi:hypothetical protein
VRVQSPGCDVWGPCGAFYVSADDARIRFNPANPKSIHDLGAVTSQPLTLFYTSCGCPAADHLQKLLWRLRSRCAIERTGRRGGGKVCRGARTHFCFWGTKTKNISPASEQKIRAVSLSRASWREAREPPISRFPPSRLPVVTCSIARGGLEPPRKLLRFRLRIGSQRCVESLVAA